MQNILSIINQYHSNDPVIENDRDKKIPRELLYSDRMIKKLKQHVQSPADFLILSAACHHLCRWEIPRENFPAGRPGYLLWRKTAHLHQAKVAEKILKDEKLDNYTIEKVIKIIKKEDLTDDADVQLIEDIACLVFVEHYLDEFGKKYDDDKLIGIIKKTMKKMSDKGIGWIKDIPFSENLKNLMQKLEDK